jgi:hypothetical protein
MDYRLPILENAARNHGVTLGAVASRLDRRTGVDKVDKMLRIMGPRGVERIMQLLAVLMVEVARHSPEASQVPANCLERRDNFRMHRNPAGF